MYGKAKRTIFRESPTPLRRNGVRPQSRKVFLTDSRRLDERIRERLLQFCYLFCENGRQPPGENGFLVSGRILTHRTTNPDFRRAIADIEEGVKAGKNIVSTAFSKGGKVSQRPTFKLVQ